MRLLICKVFPIKALDEMVCWMISVSFTIVFIIFVAKIWKNILVNLLPSVQVAELKKNENK